MVKRLKFALIQALFIPFCLNLSHAQKNPLDNTPIKQLVDSVENQVPPNTSPLPQPYPQLPEAPKPAEPATPAAPALGPDGKPIPAKAGAPDQSGLINPPVATVGKYEEYQSICRTFDYDKIKFQPVEVRNAKIAELKTAADAEGPDSIHGQLPLLKEYLEQGDKTNFNKLATLLKNKKSTTTDNDLLNSLVAMSSKNYRSATSILLKALATEGNEKNEEVLKLLAEVYSAQNNFYEAGTIYEDLNKQHPNSYLFEQCQALVLNSLNADGETVCKEAAAKSPENPFPYIYVGITHRERDSLPQAITYFKRSLAIRPTEMGTTCLAEALFIKKEYSQAAGFYKQSAELNPTSARAITGLAWSELKAKNYGAALKAFNKACALNSRYQVEIRKAFKILNTDKINEAKDFREAAETCGP